MLTIRFLRSGKRGQPFFRIVVINKKSAPRPGRFVEIVGFFNPSTKEKQLKTERIQYWLSVGAKPSESVHNLLVSEKIIQAKKINVSRRSKTTESVGAPQPSTIESAPQPTGEPVTDSASEAV